MARKRYLKPGFFSNEDLAELAFEYRLVFQGLWLWADREGRLEDRPKRLKGHIMPYDNVDFEIAFQALATAGFILRYQTLVCGKEFKAIQILTFKDHQDVHVKEQASTIPAPVLHGACTVQVTPFTGTSPSLNLELDTSTLNLELVDDDVRRDRQNEINDAIEAYTAPIVEEEKKFPPKKELPPVESVIEKLKDFEYWRIALEHNLPPGIKWNKLIPAQKKIYEDQREDYFRIFWEQKTDRYKIRMDSWAGMAEHFYNWIPIHKSKDKLRQLHGNATKRAEVHSTGNAKHNSTTDRISKNEGIADIISKSQEFLQQHNDIEYP